MRFKNWARNQVSEPKNFYEPGSEFEVQEIVRDLRVRGESVRVIGANHSWSDVGVSSQNLMSIDRLKQVVAIDLEKKQVTVGAGIRLKHLVSELAARGLAMQNLGSIDEQSIAGVISTGTHGTGLGIGNIATQVIGMRLVDGRGEVHVIENKTDLLRAARVSLGMLGIITQVTLQCVSTFRLHERSWALPFDQALEEIPLLVANHTHVKFWWLPHTRMVQVYVYEPTSEPVSERSKIADALDKAINTYVFSGIVRAGGRLPAAIPVMNKLIGATYFKSYERIANSPDIFTVAMPPRHLESEYAIPWEETVRFMQSVQYLIEGKALRVGFVNEVRFVAGDDSWLSPAHSEPVCQFGAYISDGTHAEPFFDGFDQLALQFGGRPHWGKLFGMSASDVKNAFPKYDAFVALRNQFDPDGVFDNLFTEAYFPR